MPAAEPVNLVLVYLPGAIDVEDLKKISQHARTLAENIDIHIHPDAPPAPALLDKLAQHRTLVFSPIQMRAFFVKRGRVYAGRPMQKSEQLLRLELAGAPVPTWTSLDRAKQFDPAVWGEHVVVKPEINSRGRGVIIESTRTLNARAAQIKPFSREANNFIVQKLIFNPQYSKTRIQMLFDEVLYARRFCYTEAVKLETEADVQNYQRLFISENTRAEDYADEAVFEMARRCYKAYDGVPLLALDVLFDSNGNPYFIEANPGGNTWHFSSDLIGKGLRAKGIFLEQQFGAFERAAEVLVRHTLEEAS